MVSTSNGNIAAVGTITIDGMGCITAFDEVAVRLFGYESAEVVGRNVSMLMPEPYHSQHDGYLARYHQTSTPHVIGKGREVIGRRKDGSIVPIHLSVGAMEISSAPMFVGIISDISEQKRHEAELQAKKAAEAGSALNQLFWHT